MKARDTFNRIVIVIVSLVVMAALIALFLAPTTVGNWLVSWGQFFQDGALWSGIAVGALLSLVAVVLLGMLIYWEVRSRRDRFIRVQQVAGGMAKVSTNSVKEMLEHRLDAIPGVVNVQSQVHARGNRVSVGVDADVVRGTNVPDTANLIIKDTNRVLTDELGLQLDGPPEVSVTVAREEDIDARPTARQRRERQRAAEGAPETATYTPVGTAVRGNEGAVREERQRQAVIDREKEEFRVPPERVSQERVSQEREMQERVSREREAQEREMPMRETPERVPPVREERRLYEANEPAPRETMETTSDRNIPPIPEREEVEDEGQISYHPANRKLIDPFEQGKETRTQ